MKTRIKVLLAAILPLGIALPLHAQDDSRPRREALAERQGPAYMTALDANKDGTLGKEEIEGSTAALKKLDKNSDGRLTVAELRGAPGRGPRERDERAERPERARRRGRQETEANAGRRPVLPGILAAIDANKSGTLETDELETVPAGLLKLDKNSDGQLTREEMRVRRRPGNRGAEGERPREGQRPRREGRDARPDSN